MHGKSTTIRFLTSNALSLLGNSVAGVVLPLVLSSARCPRCWRASWGAPCSIG